MATATKSVRLSAGECEAIYVEAYRAMVEAGSAFTPTPMRVVDNSTGQHWVESEGLCGFAWVNVRNGNSSFCRWLKAERHGRRDSYLGGVSVWVSRFGQSFERKRVGAAAFAAVLQSYGIECFADWRLD